MLSLIMCMLLLLVRTMMVIFQIIGSCQLMVCQRLDLALTAMLFTATRTAAFQRRHEIFCGTIQQLRHHSWFLWRPKLPEPMLLRGKRFAYTGHLKFNRDSFLGSWISCCVLFQLTCCSGKPVLGFKMSVTDNGELVSVTYDVEIGNCPPQRARRKVQVMTDGALRHCFPLLWRVSVLVTTGYKIYVFLLKRVFLTCVYVYTHTCSKSTGNKYAMDRACVFKQHEIWRRQFWPLTA